MNQKSKKYSQKTVEILKESLRVIVTMCMSVCVFFDFRFILFSIEATNPVEGKCWLQTY